MAYSRHGAVTSVERQVFLNLRLRHSVYQLLTISVKSQLYRQHTIQDTLHC